jgi:hypothetical protein
VVAEHQRRWHNAVIDLKTLGETQGLEFLNRVVEVLKAAPIILTHPSNNTTSLFQCNWLRSH